MPAYDLRPERQIGAPIIMFGGFDSYIEEFLPMIAGMVDAGRRIIVFEGPGQGSALEDFGLTMIPEWEQPVAAVLDHYGLDDVAAVGISLGGGLVIRAAAFEPRISQVVAFDILDDFFETIARQIGRGVRIPLRAMLTARARRVVNAIADWAVARKPVSQWGLQQGMHVTGTATPYDFLALDDRDGDRQDLAPGSRRRAAPRRRGRPLRAAEAVGPPGGHADSTRDR